MIGVICLLVLPATSGLASTPEGRNGSWSAAASLDACQPSPSCAGRSQHAAALLRDGKVLVVGGQAQSAEATAETATAELYDPIADNWRPTGSMTAPQGVLTATALPDGRVLVVANRGLPEIYDPRSGKWAVTSPPASNHGQHTATLLKNGKVLVAGGLSDSLGTAGVDIYGSWAATGALIQLRYEHAATLLDDGKVLVAGGWSTNYGSKRATGEIYDPAGGRWAPTGPLPFAPVGATATLLGGGKVLLAGGKVDQAKNLRGVSVATTATAVYDPATGVWSPAAPMNAARYQHTATLLADGRVLVAGGAQDGGSAGEIFDPKTGTWALTPPAAFARVGHTATQLAQGPESLCGQRCGAVVVAGGSPADPSGGLGGNRVELYRPAPSEPGGGPTASSSTGTSRVANLRRSPGGSAGLYAAVGALVVVAGAAGLVLRRRRSVRPATKPPVSG